MKTQKDYCNIIDLCKFLLTITVVLMHFESSFFNSPAKVFECGYLAVDFFFVLSGFLLYRSFKSGKYIGIWMDIIHSCVLVPEK